jgi:hypothetical protein
MTRTRPTIVLAILVAILAPLVTPPALAQDTRSADITRIDYEFERSGVRFYVDADLYNMRSQAAFVTIWFVDSGNNYLANAGNGSDYEDSQGNLSVWDVVNPCCDSTEYSRANGHTIDLFVPYSQFPSVDYDYTYRAYVNIQAKSDNATLAEGWLDQPIQVNGADDPYGYQVWLSIRGITVTNIQEDGFLEDGADEPMLTYSLGEVTADNYAGAFDAYVWADTVHTGDQVGSDPFSWVYVDVAANSAVVMWIELDEIDDYSAAQQYIGAVNGILGTLSLVTTPFKLAPPYAAGITIAAFISGMADLTVNLIALLDPNDVFGSPQEVMVPDNLRAIAATGDPWDSWYRFYNDNYDYTVNFSVFVLPYYRQRPAD